MYIVLARLPNLPYQQPTIQLLPIYGLNYPISVLLVMTRLITHHLNGPEDPETTIYIKLNRTAAEALLSLSTGTTYQRFDSGQ